MRDRTPMVYIVASQCNCTIYTGVTSDPMQRIWQHREGVIDGFTKQYGCKIRVWFEMHETMDAAIAREKQIKAWRRAWKLALFESDNPEWRDLAEEWGFEPLGSPSVRTASSC